MPACDSSGTYGVQGFEAYTTDLDLCLTCTFAEWTNVKGCLIEFFALNKNCTLVQTIQVVRKFNNVSGTECVSAASSNGLFHFIVYDIRSNGVQAKSPSVVVDTDLTIESVEMPSSSELCSVDAAFVWL